ncbi:hypothetical protein J0383_19375 [Flavobacterium endoglycinae]|uniref:DUF3185 family protein n=1 Tax=Flavobacterium endoglycinae TaxID=2816357 RepID=A0ABX7QDB8_9FLAO|nr:hypothetical protein [Flavobacterium endoglycinae]QSW88404.1 hypothetical protein J0383_19375 [Flavobacterium endoglycinae]
MNLAKIVGIVLIILSLAAGYVGLNRVADSTKEINFLGLKIDASNESGQIQGFLYLGAAVLLLAGGIYTLKKKD